MNTLIKVCAAMCAGKLIKKCVFVCVCGSSLRVWNEAFVCVLMVQLRILLKVSQPIQF